MFRASDVLWIVISLLWAFMIGESDLPQATIWFLVAVYAFSNYMSRGRS